MSECASERVSEDDLLADLELGIQKAADNDLGVKGCKNHSFGIQF